MSASPLARRLLDRAGDGHTVVSLYFDLDPGEFATAPARATQASSLLSQARAAADALSLDHDATATLRDDLTRLEEYLGSDDLPVSDARALAVFAAGGLFETVKLSAPAGPAVHVVNGPVIEPLVTAQAGPAWCAVLAALDRAEIYLGARDRIAVHQHSDDYVRGHGSQGGPTGNDESQDAEGHLIKVAAQLHHDWQRARFSVLALGGPVDAVTRLEKLLHNELRPALLPQRLEIDPSAATDSDVAAAVAELVGEATERSRGELLSRYADGLEAARGSDSPPRAVAGPDAVQEALTEQRVESLLLGVGFEGGSREAAVQAAVRQDADVIAFDDTAAQLPPARPVGALLRF